MTEGSRLSVPSRTAHWCDWFPCTKVATAVIQMGFISDLAHVCEEHGSQLDEMFRLYRKANQHLREGTGQTSGWDLPKGGLDLSKLAQTYNPSAIDMTLCECGHPSNSHYLGVFRGSGHPQNGGCYACDAQGKKCAAMKMGYRAETAGPHDPHDHLDNPQPQSGGDVADWTDQ